MYDTTSEIYDNTKTMQESLTNLKTTAEKQEAKENISKLNQSLNLSATELGYTNVEDFIQKAQATPSYKISKIIRDINNSKTQAEKEANKNEFIKMLGNIGLKQSQIKGIEGNEIIQPVLVLLHLQLLLKLLLYLLHLLVCLLLNQKQMSLIMIKRQMQTTALLISFYYSIIYY